MIRWLLREGEGERVTSRQRPEDIGEMSAA
jgi:hypothetical protein